MPRGGAWVQFVGDVDGDGRDDLLAAIGDSDPRLGIVLGREEPEAQLDPDIWLDVSPQDPGCYGAELHVASVGDVDGDGRDDFTVGPNLFLGANASEGIAILHGSRASAAGDVDRDGLDDIVFAMDDRYAVVRGRQSWSGFDAGAPSPDSFVVDRNPLDAGGLGDLRGVGDFNGDGVPDFAASKVGGAVDVVSGGAIEFGQTVQNLPDTALATIEPATEQPDWATVPGPHVPAPSLFPLGDVDGDGMADFAAGYLDFLEQHETLVVPGRASSGPIPRDDLALLQGAALTLQSIGDIDDDGESRPPRRRSQPGPGRNRTRRRPERPTLPSLVSRPRHGQPATRSGHQRRTPSRPTPQRPRFRSPNNLGRLRRRRPQRHRHRLPGPPRSIRLRRRPRRVPLAALTGPIRRLEFRQRPAHVFLSSLAGPPIATSRRRDPHAMGSAWRGSRTST